VRASDSASLRMATSDLKTAKLPRTLAPRRSAAVSLRDGWVPACVVLAALLGGGVAVVSPSRSLVLICGTALVLLVPIVVRAMQGRFDPFEPVVIFAIAYAAMFVVRTGASYARGDFFYARTTRVIDIAGTFDAMLLLGLLGAVGFVVGYSLRTGAVLAASVPPPPRQFHTGAATTTALCVAIIGVAAFVAAMATSGGRAYFQTWLAGRSEEYYEASFAGSGYLGGGFRLLCPAALALFALSRVRRSFPLLCVFAGVAALYVFVTLPTGSRISLLPFAGALFVFLFVSKGRRPGAVTLVAVGAVALLAISVVYQARNIDVSLRESVSQKLDEPSRVFDPLTRTEDTAMVLALASALTVVPGESGHTLGVATAGDLVIRPVPRAIWPAKPEPPREVLVEDLWPTERLANPEFTMALPLYWDFGLLGVLVGFLLLGVLLRFVYEYFSRHRDLLLAQLLFALAVPFIVIAVRDSPVDTVARAVFFFLPLWFIFWVSRVRSAGNEGGARRPAEGVAPGWV
jgi:hypothetical protein